MDNQGAQMRNNIDSLVLPLLDKEYIQCAAVAVLQEKPQAVFGYKRIASNNVLMSDDSTMFEIGSVTKLFTLFLLADLVRDGTMQLDSPVSNYLPDVRGFCDGQKGLMTVRHLANLTSGLPRNGDYKKPPKEPDENNMRNITVQDLYNFLADCELISTPGTQPLYSNVGYGLLGHVMEKASGASYMQMLKARILQPLNMKDTVLTMQPEQLSRLAPGHTAEGDVTPACVWGEDCPLIAAGCLKSTASDMLVFMKAWLQHENSPLGSIFDTLEKQFEYGGNGILACSGQTAGYHSFIYTDRKQQLGVVVLADTATMYITDLGNSIVTGLASGKFVPVELPQPLQTPGTVNSDWIGDYKPPSNPLFPPGTLLEVRRVESGLTIGSRIAGVSQGTSKLYQKSSATFFIRSMDVELLFEKGSLTLMPGKLASHIFGGPLTCIRMEVDQYTLATKRNISQPSHAGDGENRAR